MQPRLFGALAFVTLGACGGSSFEPIEGGPGAPPTTGVTWHQDIAPLVAERCSACHQAGGLAPVAFTTHAETAPMAALMAEAVSSRAMPPWAAGPTDDCKPLHRLRDDPTLTPEQIALFADWAAAGAPLGDPATAAPIPKPPSRDLEGATHHLEMATPHTPKGEGDTYPCILLGPPVAEDAWLTGVQVVPGNDRIVHHVGVMLDITGESAALAGPDGTFDCANSPETIVGAFTPGMAPFDLPPGVAVHVPAGSVFVLQMHYHPLSGPGEADVTAIDLRMSPTPEAQTTTYIQIGNSEAPPELQPGPNDVGGVEFRVPAMVAGHTETMVYDIDGDEGKQVRYPIWSIFPHMHYVGVDMKVRIHRSDPAPGEPADECLIGTPRYGFDWQRLYAYDAPLAEMPTIGGGDTLTLECTYDNTLANPYVARALKETGLPAPIDIHMGEESLDEMCVMVFGVAHAQQP